MPEESKNNESVFHSQEEKLREELDTSGGSDQIASSQITTGDVITNFSQENIQIL